jgi:hypothetical protein
MDDIKNATKAKEQNERATDIPAPVDEVANEFEELLYARHAEIKDKDDLLWQRGTPIPALFNTFYKFVQNPSSVSVETFKRMVDTDDTVGSGVDFLTTCLAARLGMYQHDDAEISEWVNTALESVEGGFTNVIKELLSATWAGFAVQEVVWANDPALGFIPKKMVSLPPSTILFETERTGELTYDGILQYQRNYNPAFASAGVSYLFGFGANVLSTDRSFRPDPYAKLGDFPFPLRTANTYSYLSIRIPVAKCVHYAFDAQGKFGNPYGRSLLRRCYKYYVMKDAILQMLSVALDRKGTPLTLVYADPNMTLLDPNKTAQGVNQRGQKVGIRADLAAREAFRQIHNDTTIILPGKKGQVFDTDFVPQTSNAGDFLEALRFCNQSILRALLIPTLIFGNGDGSGSYSLGQEHAKTFDKILDGMLAGLKHVLLQQLIRPMLALNFEKERWERPGLGDFSKRELSSDEIDKEINVIEKAVNIGAIDMSDMNDLNKVRDKIGFDARDTPIQNPNDIEEAGTQYDPRDPNSPNSSGLPGGSAGQPNPLDDQTTADTGPEQIGYQPGGRGVDAGPVEKGDANPIEKAPIPNPARKTEKAGGLKRFLGWMTRFASLEELPTSLDNAMDRALGLSRAIDTNTILPEQAMAEFKDLKDYRVRNLNQDKTLEPLDRELDLIETKIKTMQAKNEQR